MSEQKLQENRPSSSRHAKRRTFDVSEAAAQYDHEVLDIARVVRVVKGGRRFRFRASVVVGNRKGVVGFGMGKAKDIQQAIMKAQEQAAKRVVTIRLNEGRIEHTVKATFKGAEVMIKPAQPGTGVIAGEAVRMVAELAGISDVVTKMQGSNNKVNNVHATLKALQKLQTRKKRS